MLATCRYPALATLALVLPLCGGAAFAQSETGISGKKPAEPAPPPAAETPFFDATFGARFQSDYNFRGISQSALRPSVQGYTELTFGGGLVYVGVAPYQTRLPTNPLAEIDITGGIRPKFGNFTFDLGFIRYEYPDERRFIDPNTGGIVTPGNTDYTEIAGKVSYNFDDRFIAGLNVFHGFNFLGTGTDNTYFSGTFKYNIPTEPFAGTFLGDGQFYVSTEIAHHFFSGRTSVGLGAIRLPDYTYGNVGIAYTYKNVTLDARYHDTTLTRQECFLQTGDPKGVFSGSGQSRWCGAAFIGTLSADFTASQLGIFAPR